MHLSTPVKKLCLLFLALIAASCSGGTDRNGNLPLFVDNASESPIPFLNKEPEAYTATLEIVFANRVERKFVARKGDLRRVDHRYGTDRQLTVIENEQTFIFDPERKIFAEIEERTDLAEPDFISDLAWQLLTKKHDTVFTKLDDESGLSRYRVTLALGDSSEVIVYVDPDLQMPVRQEFFTVIGETKRLDYSVVFRDMVLSAEDSLFQIPQDHKKVSIATFYKTIRQRK